MLEAELLSQIAHRESGGNPRATNPGSTASGLYQFIDPTWRWISSITGVGKQYARAKDAPEDVQTHNAKWLLHKYGPNSSVSWAASAPPGGYKTVDYKSPYKGSASREEDVPQSFTAPNGQKLQFPPDATPEEIQQYVKQYYPAQEKPPENTNKQDNKQDDNKATVKPPKTNIPPAVAERAKSSPMMQRFAQHIYTPYATSGDPRTKQAADIIEGAGKDLLPFALSETGGEILGAPGVSGKLAQLGKLGLRAVGGYMGAGATGAATGALGGDENAQRLARDIGGAAGFGLAPRIAGSPIARAVAIPIISRALHLPGGMITDAALEALNLPGSRRAIMNALLKRPTAAPAERIATPGEISRTTEYGRSTVPPRNVGPIPQGAGGYQAQSWQDPRVIQPQGLTMGATGPIQPREQGPVPFGAGGYQRSTLPVQAPVPEPAPARRFATPEEAGRMTTQAAPTIAPSITPKPVPTLRPIVQRMAEHFIGKDLDAIKASAKDWKSRSNLANELNLGRVPSEKSVIEAANAAPEIHAERIARESAKRATAAQQIQFGGGTIKGTLTPPNRPF